MDIINEMQQEAQNVSGIHLQDVWKSYGRGKAKFHVLKGLNLIVPQGTIYGLLGPSGCGKTTLLKCILGRLTIDAGHLSVMGVPPENIMHYRGDPLSHPDVGYMPQDIALNTNLTVKETIRLFGALYGLTPKATKARSAFLLKFLGITCLNKYIGQLSGGQQRRTSFAIALLHKPTLLILDEPTVGVDPVLRKNIWDYLNMLVNDKINPATIIITTHYIEEARMARNVGLMLNGQLLAQGGPADLILEHGFTTLEQVFLKLCLAEEEVQYRPEVVSLKKETMEINDNKIDLEKQKNGNIFPVNEQKVNQREVCQKATRYNTSEIPRWHRVYALFQKNILFYMRHYGLLIFEIFLPPIIIFLFTYTIGTPLFRLPVGVINNDSLDLGQLFLNSIDENMISQYHYGSYEEANTATSLGIIRGIVHINSRFSNATRVRFGHGALSDDISLLDSEIGITLDWTSQQVAYAINNELIMAFERFAIELLRQLGLNPTLGEFPVKHDPRQVYGDLRISFDQFLFPGIFVCIAFFMAMTLTAVSLNLEKKSGALERLTITGVLSIEIILSHLFTQLFVLTAQIFLMCVTSFAIVGFVCKGSYVWVVLLAFIQGFCGMNLGFLLSAVLEGEAMTVMICIAVWSFFLFAEGYLWPVEALDVVLRFISRLMPQTMTIEAMRSIINRGWGLLDPEVYTSLIITFVWAFIFLLLAWFISRRRM